MKKTIAALSPLALLAVVAILALGGWPAPGADGGGAAGPSADATPGLELSSPVLEPAVPGACTEAPTSAVAGTEQLACCIDECSRDRDCRAICGKEFGGQCVQVNSCCRQCACLGFAPATGLPS